MDNKETFSRINFVVNMVLLILLFVGVASSEDWNLGLPSTFVNLTIGNLTVTDGSLSNVVLTTNTAYLQNSSVLNSSSGTWKRNSNGSIELTTTATFFNGSIVEDTVYPSNFSVMVVGWRINNVAYAACVTFGASNPPTENSVCGSSSVSALDSGTGQTVVILNTTDYYKVESGATLSNLRIWGYK